MRHHLTQKSSHKKKEEKQRFGNCFLSNINWQTKQNEKSNTKAFVFAIYNGIFVGAEAKVFLQKCAILVPHLQKMTWQCLFVRNFVGGVECVWGFEVFLKLWRGKKCKEKIIWNWIIKQACIIFTSRYWLQWQRNVIFTSCTSSMKLKGLIWSIKMIRSWKIVVGKKIWVRFMKMIFIFNVFPGEIWSKKKKRNFFLVSDCFHMDR